jgi:ABC-type glutathione transport system ATPase component
MGILHLPESQRPGLRKCEYKWMHILVQIKNLSVFYGHGHRIAALKNISLTCSQGEILAIVGASGSGKSTLACAILQLLDASAQMTGIIQYNGAEIYPHAALPVQSLRGRKIAMIFQEPLLAFNPVFRIGHQIAETMCQHLQVSKSQAHEKIAGLFAQLGLEPAERIYRSFPHELSGGMRQRAMIAMAVSCNPELIIADEPTSSLDYELKHEIMSLLSGYSARLSASLLLITHDISLATEYSHRILILEKGKIKDNIKESSPELLSMAFKYGEADEFACRN